VRFLNGVIHFILFSVQTADLSTIVRGENVKVDDFARWRTSALAKRKSARCDLVGVSQYDELELTSCAAMQTSMATNISGKFLSHKTTWLILLLVVLVSLAVVALPAWIIQPFRPQTPRGVGLSYALRRWSPLLTIVALAVALLLILWLWRGSRRWWRKALLVIVLLPLLASTWFARQNHFEWMFNPLANAAYAKPAQAGFLADDDIVMAVDSNGEAAAYPVRQMAYHHVVQDVVGGTPIVATY
jgi:small-conductance mechanosensitive channel